MPTTQFKIYTSEDKGGPGLINGLTGSLVSVLNACLITGYGTSSYYKAPAGWLKPCPDSGSGVGPYPYCYGAWQQPSGSGFSLFVNDNYPANVSYGEAWIAGYEYISSSFPVLTTAPTAHAGQGIGQFPLPAQLQTYGVLNIRKSATNTAVGRSWIIAADEYTLYMWIFTGDTSTVYCNHWGFGDFYSLAGTADQGRCLIYGRWSGQGIGSDITECISDGPSRDGYSWTSNPMKQALYGHYIANTISGFVGSIWAFKKGDYSMSRGATSVTTNYGYATQDGIYAFPQPYDYAMYISPLWIGEPTSQGVRGRYRGLYQPLHYATSFQNGQVISGSGDYSGRTFMMIQLGRNSGHWALEISPTVEAN